MEWRSCDVTFFSPIRVLVVKIHTGFAEFEEPYVDGAWVQSWTWKQGSWRDVLDPKFIGPGPHNCKPAPLEALECVLPLPTTSARVSEYLWWWCAAIASRQPAAPTWSPWLTLFLSFGDMVGKFCNNFKASQVNNLFRFNHSFDSICTGCACVCLSLSLPIDVRPFVHDAVASCDYVVGYTYLGNQCCWRAQSVHWRHIPSYVHMMCKLDTQKATNAPNIVSVTQSWMHELIVVMS